MADEAADASVWVVETQQLLGAIIKRPKLTPALLQKPPFRFLHDIVSEVTKATGFADGLFDGDELQSAKIKDKDSKLSYLAKIIKCVEFATGSTIQIRPGKVVAGLEAENTNAFLQMLAKAATSGADSAAAVSRVLALDTSAEAAAPPPAAPPPPQQEAPRATPAPMAPPPSAYAAAPPPQPASTQGPVAGPLQQMSSAPMPKPDEGAAPEERKPERPRTARRAPPKLASNEVKVEKRTMGGDAAPISGVIMEDGEEAEDDDTILMVDQQGEALDTRSMLKGGDGEGHGKLVRNLLDAKNEMEKSAEDKDKGGDKEDASDSGIILGKKPGAGNAARLPSKTEIETLRATIQTLCQSCNPLGRCLEYVQEDLEAMAKELEHWRSVRRIKEAELTEEESTTEGSLVPLQNELANVEAQVKEKRSQIRFYKAAVVRNDAAIERLLAQVVQTG